MDGLPIEDVEAIVRLLATTLDPAASLSVAQRKRMLIERIAELVGADVWIWTTSVQSTKVAGDAMSVNLLDGGWKDDAERVGLVCFLTQPETAVPSGRPVMRLMQQGRHFTMPGEELIPPEVWGQVADRYYAIGLKHFLLSIYPLDDKSFSGIGLHRRSHRPPFSQRERIIVHAVLEQVDWLHRHGTDVPAKDHVLDLSPRQRQILLFLLSGQSLRHIAQHLGLSEHTVRSHVKDLYRQLQVNNRSSLLARFVSGGGVLPPAE